MVAAVYVLCLVLAIAMIAIGLELRHRSRLLVQIREQNQQLLQLLEGAQRIKVEFLDPNGDRVHVLNPRPRDSSAAAVPREPL